MSCAIHKVVYGIPGIPIATFYGTPIAAYSCTIHMWLTLEVVERGRNMDDLDIYHDISPMKRAPYR